jgi:Fur family transcriptional regulator, ferric uptake regulator
MLKEPQHDVQPHERSIQTAEVYCSANELKATLHDLGFRLTVQRQKILSIFQTLTQGNHLSAEELHTMLHQKGERISLSTVYRTLNLMAKIGLIRELEFAEGHKHYELNQPSSHQHHHLVCLQCNRILEFKNDLVLKMGFRQTKSCGYQLLDCQLTLRVICLEAFEQDWQTLPSDWICSRSMLPHPSV